MMKWKENLKNNIEHHQKRSENLQINKNNENEIKCQKMKKRTQHVNMH